MTIRIGLLGAGRIGSVHARSLAGIPGASLQAVVDPYPQAAGKIAGTYGCAIRSVEDIEADADIDAVLICTPNDTHADLVERFARAGKAIFCEKPIDLDIARVRSCLDVVEECGTTLMTGFNRRFDVNFSRLRDRIASGEIGSIETMIIISRDPAPPPYDYISKSGGLFRDMTIHDFDMARYIIGEEFVRVTASSSVMVDGEIASYDDWDTACVIMTTGSGRHCMISNSRRATYGYDQRIEVHGSRGMLSVGNPRDTEIELADKGGFHRPELMDFFMDRYVEAFATEISEFVHCLQNGTRPEPSGHDGLKALELANAAVRSVVTGKAVDV